MRGSRTIRWPSARPAAAVLVALGFGLGAAAARAQRVGVFFDAAATQCTGAISRFECVHVRVVAWPERGEAIAGALFGIDLPADVEVQGGDPEGLFFPGRDRPEVRGTLAGGLDLQYFPCVPGDSVLTLVEFDACDYSFSGPNPRPDLRLHLVGAAIDSMAAAMKPRLKICDPEEPMGYRELVEAGPHDAILNCAVNCTCTIAVASRPWSAIKSLYARP